MCDQTELSYGDGDVVWVKIGPIWWPGVVKDVSKEGKENEVLGGLKNKPIAIVQFFDEDKYEFVKNLENIYHYNCRRKDEFIKKGLDKFRSGAKHMIKFPEDVIKAEELVKGDINIINDPKFAPQEKKNNYSELFGTPKKKTRKTEEMIKTKFLPLKKRLSAPPGRSVASNGPGPSRRADLSCPLCDFSANLVATISSHFLYFHSSRRVNYGNDAEGSPIRRNVEPKRARPTPGPSKKRGRPSKPKQETPSTSNATENSASGSPVRTVASNATTLEKAADKKKRFTDALLADWSEDEDNKGEEVVNTKDLNENINVAEEVDAPKGETASAPKPQVAETPMEVEEDNRNSTGSTEGTNDNDKRETSSCFDFDDEDDGFIGMSDAYTYGRKIPRVIPVKDKTDLGRDMEVDEVFRKKPDSESMDDENAESESEEEPIKKKRGRQPKNPKATSPKKVAKLVAVPKTGLAATRQRRPGARKSYLNEVIEKIEDDASPTEHAEVGNVQSRHSAKKASVVGEVVEYEKIQEFEPEFLDNEEMEQEKRPKSSRRKQDLKSQKLMEYDDVESLVVAQKKQMELKKKMNKEKTERNPRDLEKTSAEDEERNNGANILLAAGKDTPPTSQKVDDSADDDLTAQVESLLAETKAPTVFSKVKAFNILPKSQVISEDISEEIEYLEDDPPMITSPVKQTVQASPVKKIKSLDLEQAIKKSAIPQWRQGIQESLKLNKEVTLKEGIKKVEPGKTNIIKLSGRGVQPAQKGARYLILSPQQAIVSNSSTTQRVCKIATMPRTTATSAVNIDPSRKKIITLSANAVQQKQVIEGEKYQMIKNFNGTGKTAVILKDAGGSVTRKIMVAPEKKCYIQRKGPDGNITLQSIVSPKRTHKLVINNQHLKFVPIPSEAVAEPPIVEPVVEPVVSEAVHQLPTTQHVIMPATGDMQPTYMLVTVDGQTMLQPVDSSLLPTYTIQPQATTQLYETPTEEMKPVYSTPGQDILAEALANTNVLESEMPLMMPSVVQETCVTLQKPIMTPMEVPTNAIPDTSLLIAPVVQETSITLQKPIMTPLEVPTSIVTDASGLEPPPLPPTPTEEDVMMEDNEDALMIAEQPPADQQTQLETPQDAQHQGNFFIDDSQEGEEGNAFQSMPLLNEESTASEEHIADQNFNAQVAQIGTSEFLPTSTNADLEPEQGEPTEPEAALTGYRGDETEDDVGKETKESSSLPSLTDEAYVVCACDSQTSGETEVSSTTEDSKGNVA